MQSIDSMETYSYWMTNDVGGEKEEVKYNSIIKPCKNDKLKRI